MVYATVSVVVSPFRCEHTMTRQFFLSVAMFAALSSAVAQMPAKSQVDSFGVVLADDKEVNTIKFRCVQENTGLAIRCSTNTLTISRHSFNTDKSQKEKSNCSISTRDESGGVYQSKAPGVWQRTETAFVCDSAVQQTITLNGGIATYEEVVLKNNSDVMCTKVLGRAGNIKRFSPLLGIADFKMSCDTMRILSTP